MQNTERTYHRNGRLKREIQYTKAFSDYSDSQYYPSGALQQVTRYVDKRSQWTKTYSETGEVIEVLIFKGYKTVYSSSKIGGKHRKRLSSKEKELRFEYSAGRLVKAWKRNKKTKLTSIYINGALAERFGVEKGARIHKWFRPEGRLERIEVEGVNIPIENYDDPSTIDSAVFENTSTEPVRKAFIAFLQRRLVEIDRVRLVTAAMCSFELVSARDDLNKRKLYLKITTPNSRYIYDEKGVSLYERFSVNGWNHKRLKLPDKLLSFVYRDGKPTMREKVLVSPQGMKSYLNGVLIESVISEGRVEREHKYFSNDGSLRKVIVFGAEIPVEAYLHPERLDPTVVLTERNATVRRAYISLIGYSTLLSRIPNRLIHKDGDYELLEIDAPKEILGVIRLLKVVCPSTGVFYTLRVLPTHKTCKSALAWTFNVPEEEYRLEEEA